MCQGIQLRIQLVMTDLPEFWFTMAIVAFYIAFIFAFPICLYNIWAFFKPGLYQTEAKRIANLFFFSLLLFLIGFCFHLFIIWPILVKVLFVDQAQSLQFKCLPKLLPYILLLIRTLCFSSFIFQSPIIVHLILTIFSPEALTQYLVSQRRFWYLFFLIFSAWLSPPDIISQLLLSVLLCLFYEFVIVYCFIALINIRP